MKKVFITLLTLLITIAGFCQPAKHVVLITIDGSRPDFYLDSSWHAVNIRQLMKDGAYAMGVNSVFPSMTYPSHTTIVTGVQPAKHGVYFNAMFEPTGSTGKIYWNDSSIKKPTIWDAAQKKGLKVAALFWPVAGDAPVMYNIPDIDKMGEVVREKFSKPAGIVPELKKNVFNGASSINYGQDTNNARIAAYIIKRDKPNLMTIHFFYVDHAEHLSGREGDSVRIAVVNADKGIGIIVNALKEAGIWDQTVLIITGDHGFKNVSTTVNPNVWLMQAGLITNVKTDEWKAQFFSVGGSSYLYLKDRKDAKTLARVHEILSGLPDDQKKLFRIVNRAELNAIGGNPEVEFALSSMNGASFGNGFFGNASCAGQRRSAWALPGFEGNTNRLCCARPGDKEGSCSSGYES